MDRIKIHGGVKLQGNVRIQGSKNAALPILAAALLTEGESVLYNVPKISDVDKMLKVLACMGCSIRYVDNGIRIQNCYQEEQEIPDELITGMRSSMYMLGVCLGCGRNVSMRYPGGCVIGSRPMDMHLQALEKMGARFQIYEDRIYADTEGRLHGAQIVLRFPSVGATENVILAAVLARGRTTIWGAAMEPEVTALCKYLNACGARIQGVGTSVIQIDGVSGMKGSSFSIPGDRIVAGTYMFMTAMTGGCGLFEGIQAEELEEVLHLLKRAGCEYQIGTEGIFLDAPEKLLPVKKIETQVYPGFPTDLQSQALVLGIKMTGRTVIEENIFENRFQIVDQLRLMGADIEMLNSRSAAVSGIKALKGCVVEAEELRGGAALVAAGLIAEGVTSVEGCHYIDRGYENICKDLRELGARIYRDK